MATLWIWKNFVNGNPEFWAFHTPYPVDAGGNPLVLGEPVGYAIIRESYNGRGDRTDAQVVDAIKRASARHP